MRPILDRFLCCIELETGGLIIGWFGVVVSCAIAVFFSLSLVRSFLLCTRQDQCFTILLFFLINVAICLGFFISFVYLISGTQSRKHRKIIPAISLLGLAAFVSAVAFALNLENFDHEGMGMTAMSFVVSFHSFIAAVSLYIKFENEFQATQVSV